MRIAAFALIAALCIAYTSARLDVRTAITDFLPRDQRSARLELARELSQAPQARVVVLMLGARDEAAHMRAARAMAARLRASGAFEWVRGGLAESDQQRLYGLFFPARVGLLELPEAAGPVADDWIDARVAALRERLAGPLGMLERRLAPEDPLGAFAGLLERQARARGRLRLSGDQLVTEDDRFSVLFAATKASPFEAAPQARVERIIASAFAAERAGDPSLTLEWSGINRYARAGERSVRGDIERISILSLAGIFLLYVIVFRSLREPLLVLLPITFGCLVATAICQLVFGFVHGLALAFGASIIGVAEDYSTHYFAHRLAVPESEDNESLMRRLWPGMWMGALTTIAGIAMLFGAGFPGLSQMAAFGALGVLGALLTTRYVLPSLSRRRPRAQRSRFGRRTELLVLQISQRPRRALWFVGPALLAMAVGLPRLSFLDSVAALRTPEPALEAESKRVQERLGRSARTQLVVALGDDDEQALERAEAARARLTQARDAHLLRSFRSVAELLPSTATQRARHARLANDPTFVPRLRAALARHGFVPDAFAPFEAALAREFEPLSAHELLASPVADLIAPFRSPLGGRVAYLTPVEAERDLSPELAGLAGVTFLDQEALFSDAYARFRSRALSMVLLGLVLVLVTLYARYRSVRVAALGMLPALLGAGAALGVAALAGGPATLMHVIGMLLVLSMGVDYGIYVLESKHSVEEGATTLGGVLLAALTTVLSFGLLGLSANPALAAIGATVGYGMVFTVLASPVVLAFTRAERT